MFNHFHPLKPKKTSAFDFTHHFLVATPNIETDIFANTVVYICRHDNQGVLGLIINKPNHNNCIAKLFEELGVVVTTTNLHKRYALKSGPVSPEVGFVLHTGQGVWASSFVIQENICITMSRDILHHIASGQGVQHIELCLGHCRWQAGQLEDEIAQGDWLVAPADSEILFNTPYKQRYDKVCQKLGVNFDIFSTEIGYA
ncbi:transcriptional regulator [Moraxella macacae 0408225]|uniref:UPF0301 protein MOMA_02440 n=1 Tax=Moraxella macacae 0408225 TaxID=1230338 RepID=L2F861_9GAMM|nr:YqgE/AlgH family protein [Moraxella macacae]ELA09227.1 transcriptional regulator [Moraxella macacae 0408225]